MSDQLEKRGKALENEYFRKKEEELIAKMKEKMASETMKELELSCPKCDGTLLETDYEGVVIDICNKCSGVWLDAGELAQLVDKEDQGWLKGFFG